MKKLDVDQTKCISCGLCVGLDNEHFEFDDNSLSKVISQENLETSELAQAVESCPTGAITLEDDTKEDDEKN